jgi:hypothetical protein
MSRCLSIDTWIEKKASRGFIVIWCLCLVPTCVCMVAVAVRPRIHCTCINWRRVRLMRRKAGRKLWDHSDTQ